MYYICNSLTLFRKILSENSVLVQLTRNFSPYMEPKRALQHQQISNTSQATSIPSTFQDQKTDASVEYECLRERERDATWFCRRESQAQGKNTQAPVLILTTAKILKT